VSESVQQPYWLSIKAGENLCRKKKILERPRLRTSRGNIHIWTKKAVGDGVDWGFYLGGVVGAAVGAACGVVGDGLGADVTGGPEDAGADDLRAHRVRRQALLVPSP
jgi:hypothetical protein